jgi:hypothetical protein
MYPVKALQDRASTHELTYEAFPAGPPSGEVVLTRQNMLGLSPVTVAKVCFVHMSIVQPKAFFGEPDGSSSYKL